MSYCRRTDCVCRRPLSPLQWPRHDVRPGGTRPWYHVFNVDEIASPALLVYLDRVDDNIREMIGVAGSVERLRPHVKTHKLPEVIRRQLVLGIRKFKCATIAEAEMLGGVRLSRRACSRISRSGRTSTGCGSCPLAFRPPRSPRSWTMKGSSGGCPSAFSGTGRTIALLVDLDSGMHRSGIAPGPGRCAVRQSSPSCRASRPEGCTRTTATSVTRISTRAAAASDAAFEPVARFGRELEARRLSGAASGRRRHADVSGSRRRSGRRAEPRHLHLLGRGLRHRSCPTCRSGPRRCVLTRVVSRPGGERLCLDLGHKAIASENPHPRVQLLNLPDATPVMHSEEHLVVETPHADRFAVGDAVLRRPVAHLSHRSALRRCHRHR